MGILRDLSTGNFAAAMAGISAMQTEINDILRSPEISIDRFLAEYDADSDIWWSLSTGEMQQRFEQLIDLYNQVAELLQNLVEAISEDQNGDVLLLYVDDPDALDKAQRWLSLTNP